MQEKNMIFLKKKHVIPKQGGGGGGPPLGKNSHIFPFFLGGASLSAQAPARGGFLLRVEFESSCSKMSEYRVECRVAIAVHWLTT